MSFEIEWQKKAANLLKSELARKGMGYDELRQALSNIGIIKTTNNINVTINRGTFSFVFFLQCVEALQLDKIQLK